MIFKIAFIAALFVSAVRGADNACGKETISGKDYDLSPLSKNTQTNVGTFGKYEYQWNYCQDSVSCGTLNVVSAQIDAGTSSTTCYPIGQESGVTYSALPSGDGIIVDYVVADPKYQCSGGVTRKTRFEITCDAKASTIPQSSDVTISDSDPSQSKCIYVFSFKSPVGCPVGASSGGNGGGPGGKKGGLSGGSIFLIIFFVTLAVYFIFGSIINWKVRHVVDSPSTDMLPNVELWRALPGLFVDGCVFTKNKIMGLRGGYSSV